VNKPDSVLIAISLVCDICSLTPSIPWCPRTSVLPRRGDNVPFEGCSREDYPFHSHSSLLLSNSVNSEFVTYSTCE
jgi:hypothetical protein